MLTIATFILVCGIVWGGFIFLLMFAMKKEKAKVK